MAERSGGRGVDSFFLKMLAIVTMTCNHAGYIFNGQLPFEAYCMLIGVGGFTFPIMAYLVLVGYRHTRSVKSYALRMLVFALISEIPFWLFLGHEGNVMFTLLAGLLAFRLDDAVENRWLLTGAVVLLALATLFCDWGVIGVLAMYLFKRFEGRPGAVYLPLAVVAVVAGAYGLQELAEESADAIPSIAYACANMAAAPLLARYNGERGYPLKYFFYAYYPLHIAVLGIAARALSA